MWFQLMILSIVALFIIVMGDRTSYMDLLIFYGLACLSFLMILFSWIPIVIDVFSDRLLHFRNYWNISAVFVSNNIVSISFSRKKCEIESDLASFPIVFIPTRDEGQD
jgi:hypothetical protein